MKANNDQPIQHDGVDHVVPAVNVWSFGPPVEDTDTYADGTVVPSRRQSLLLNGKPVGEIEIHMHKRKGPDRLADVSFGITAVVFGPAPGGK